MVLRDFRVLGVNCFYMAVVCGKYSKTVPKSLLWLFTVSVVVLEMLSRLVIAKGFFYLLDGIDGRNFETGGMPLGLSCLHFIGTRLMK